MTGDLKAVLLFLVDEVEYLRASQGVAIATLRNQLNQSAFATETAIDRAKFLNKTPYDALRKRSEELA